MSFRMDYLIECLQSGSQYITVNIKMTIIIFVISTFLAFLIATVRFFKVPVLSQFLAFFVTVYMGIPAVLALNVYYLLVAMTINDIADFFHLPISLSTFDFFLVAYFALIVSNSCWISEQFRSAYKAIDQIQFEAGYSVGMTRIATLRRIILPQILVVVLPALVNYLTGTLKNLSLISTIGLIEVMGGATIPCGRTYSYLEGYVAAAIIYWLMVVVAERLGGIAEKQVGKFRGRVAT